MTDLDGSLVAITGGARGIGLATAQVLHEAGARVHIGDLDGDLAAAKARELGLAGGHVLDVSDRTSFGSFLESAETDGGLDALVNNAGVMPFGRFVDQDDAVSDQVIAVNLAGVINGMRLVLPGMVDRRRGHVVNVASLAARLPVPGAAVYSGTKAAVVAMTDAVRRELDGTGVRLTCVLPTMVATELVSGAPEGRGLHAVEPEQVAATIAAALRGGGGTRVAGPGWLDPFSRVAGVVPRFLEDRLRSLVDDGRLLSRLDGEARADYDARLAEQRRRA